jgi:SAM-dependent methyltransferase
MSMDQPKSTTSTGQGDGSSPQLDTWAAIEREMRTRDSDATIYEEAFFTDFQSAVELQAYAKGFAGTVGKRALEVGCATGRTLNTMPTSNPVVGIDLSREELLIARERFEWRADLIQASATHLPFKDGTFDQVLCAGVMLHLPDQTTRELAVAEMGRVAARPGRIVIATHGYSWVVKRMFEKQREEHNLSWYRFDADELEDLIRRKLAPCRVEVRGICHLPRWRIGNRLGSFGVWLDGMLSRIPMLKYLSGTILVATVDCLPRSERAASTVGATKAGV